jgi:aryl-alcohol dehydrogenase-like predicted oxidoreductase
VEYVYLGTTGLRVSQLALGTMTFGKEADEAMSRAIMDRALDAGINFFDTAHTYNKGVTEAIIGRWLGRRRQEIILASKVFFPADGGMNDKGSSRRNLILSTEKTLQRLQTDYVDILYLHHWDENTAIEESLMAVNTLIEQGKVHYCALSNFSAWQIMKAISVTQLCQLMPVVAVQPMYNLLKRQAEVEILPLAQYEKLAVIPYNVLGAGMLTGKYLKGESGRIEESEMYRRRYEDDIYTEVTARFVTCAEKHGHAPAALAAAWVMAHPGVTAPIIGARNLDQFEDTMRCLDIALSPEEREAISALSFTPPTATDRERAMLNF